MAESLYSVNKRIEEYDPSLLSLGERLALNDPQLRQSVQDTATRQQEKQQYEAKKDQFRVKATGAFDPPEPTTGDVIGDVLSDYKDGLDYVLGSPTRDTIKGALTLFGGDIDRNKPIEEWTTRDYMIQDMDDQNARANEWAQGSRKLIMDEYGTGAGVAWGTTMAGYQTAAAIVGTIYGSKAIPTGAAFTALGATGKTGAALANMTRIGAYKFVTTPGTMEERATQAARYVLYALTPFLSGPAAGKIAELIGSTAKQADYMAKFIDFFDNTAISAGLGLYSEVESQAKQTAQQDGKQWENLSTVEKFYYRLEKITPIALTDLIFSLSTKAQKPLSQIKAELSADPVGAELIKGIDLSKGSEKQFLKVFRGDYDSKSEVESKKILAENLVQKSGDTLKADAMNITGVLSGIKELDTPDKLRTALVTLRNLGLSQGTAQEALTKNGDTPREGGITDRERFVIGTLMPERMESFDKDIENNKRAKQEYEQDEVLTASVMKDLTAGGTIGMENGLSTPEVMANIGKRTGETPSETLARSSKSLESVAQRVLENRLLAAKQNGIVYTSQEAAKDIEVLFKELGYDDADIKAWKKDPGDLFKVEAEPAKSIFDQRIAEAQGKAEWGKYEQVLQQKILAIEDMGENADMKVAIDETRDDLYPSATEAERASLDQWHKDAQRMVPVQGKEGIEQRAVRLSDEQKDFNTKADQEFDEAWGNLVSKGAAEKATMGEVADEVIERMGSKYDPSVVQQWRNANVPVEGQQSGYDKRIQSGERTQNIQQAYTKSIQDGTIPLTRDERISFIADKLGISKQEATQAVSESEPKPKVITPKEADYAKTYTAEQAKNAATARALELYSEHINGAFKDESGPNRTDILASIIAEEMKANHPNFSKADIKAAITEKMPWKSFKQSPEMKLLKIMEKKEVALEDAERNAATAEAKAKATQDKADFELARESQRIIYSKQATKEAIEMVNERWPSAFNNTKRAAALEYLGKMSEDYGAKLTPNKEVLDSAFAEKKLTAAEKADAENRANQLYQKAEETYGLAKKAMEGQEDADNPIAIARNAVIAANRIDYPKGKKADLIDYIRAKSIDEMYKAGDNIIEADFGAAGGVKPAEPGLRVVGEPDAAQTLKTTPSPTTAKVDANDKAKVDAAAAKIAEEAKTLPNGGTLAELRDRLKKAGRTNGESIGEAKTIQDNARKHQIDQAKANIDPASKPTTAIWRTGKGYGYEVTIKSIENGVATLDNGAKVNVSELYNKTHANRSIPKSTTGIDKDLIVTGKIEYALDVLADKIATSKNQGEAEKAILRNDVLGKIVYGKAYDLKVELLKQELNDFLKNDKAITDPNRNSIDSYNKNDNAERAELSRAIDQVFANKLTDLARKRLPLEAEVSTRETILYSIFGKSYMPRNGDEFSENRSREWYNKRTFGGSMGTRVDTDPSLAQAPKIVEDVQKELIRLMKGDKNLIALLNTSKNEKEFIASVNEYVEKNQVAPGAKEAKNKDAVALKASVQSAAKFLEEVGSDRFLEILIAARDNYNAKGEVGKGDITASGLKELIGDNPLGVKITNAPESADKDTLASYSKDGIVIYADRMTSLAQAWRIMLDEVKHRGVEILGREGKGSWLDRIMSGYGKERWTGKLEETLRKYTDWDGKQDAKEYFETLKEDKGRVFEEMVVHAKTEMPTAYRKIMSDLKLRASKLFPGVKLSDKDLQAQLWKALEAGVKDEAFEAAEGIRSEKGAYEKKERIFETATTKFGSVSKAIEARDAAGYKGTWMKFVAENAPARNAPTTEQQGNRLSDVLFKDVMTHKPLADSTIDSIPGLRKARDVLHRATGAGETLPSALSRMGKKISQRAAEDFSAVIGENARIYMGVQKVKNSNRKLTKSIGLDRMDKNLGKDASGQVIRGTKAMRLTLSAYSRMGRLSEVVRAYQNASGGIDAKTKAANDAIAKISTQEGISEAQLKKTVYAFMGKKDTVDGKSVLRYDTNLAREFTTDEVGSLRTYKLRATDVLRIANGTTAAERQWLDREYGGITKLLGPQLEASYNAQNEGKKLEMIGGFYATLLRDFKPNTPEQRMERQQNPQFISEDYREGIIALDVDNTPATKARTFSDAPIKWIGADRMLEKHIADVAKYVSGNQTWNAWKAGLQDNKNDIIKRFGESYYRNIISNIEKQEGVIDTRNEQGERFANWALGRFTKVILQNPVTWAKQVASFPSFAVPFDFKALGYATANRATGEGRSIIRKIREQSHTAQWRLENVRVETDYLGGSSQWREKYKASTKSKSLLGNIAMTGKLSDMVSKVTGRVDAWTINGGMLASYDYVRRTTSLRGDALIKEAAKQFDIALNTTQVSGEIAFMSPLRLSRGPIARTFSFMSGATSAAWNHTATDFHNWSNNKSAANTGQLMKSLTAITMQVAIVTAISYQMKKLTSDNDEDATDIAYNAANNAIAMTPAGGVTGPALLSALAKYLGDNARASKLSFRGREMPHQKPFSLFRDAFDAIQSGDSAKGARAMQKLADFLLGLNTEYPTKILQTANEN